jgi:nucleotide-binding universal stress UspA family protein
MIPDERLLRRILVALDASAPSLVALEAAIRLSGRLQASLKGLYVEDVSLAKLAAHPCATTFSLVCPPGNPASCEDDILLRALKLKESQARRALDEASRNARIQAEFLMRQGRVETEILAEAQKADLLILGWTGRPGSLPARPTKPGSMARAALLGAASSVLLLQHRPFGEGPLMLAYDGSSAADRALAAAAELASQDGGTLAVLLLADDPRTAQELERRVEAYVEDRRLKCRYQTLPQATADKLKRSVALVPGGILVLAAGMPLLDQGGIGSLLEGISCSVALIR